MKEEKVRVFTRLYLGVRRGLDSPPTEASMCQCNVDEHELFLVLRTGI